MKQVLGPIFGYLRAWTKISKELPGGLLDKFLKELWEILKIPFALEPG